VLGDPLLRSNARAARHDGFTLIELVMVIVLVGILSAVAMPRFASRDGYDVAGFAEDARGVLRYAQKMAIAQHRNVSVNLDASGRAISPCFDTVYPCASPIPDPTGGSALRLTPATTIAFATTISQLTFDWRGSPNGTALTLTVSPNSGGTASTVIVDGDTGYVQ
jgi:MSHA pilin protein MshC